MFSTLSWQQQVPKSTQFDDVYFSLENGLDESFYVFIQHNQLVSRFKQMSQSQIFTIGELGFGVGLNFLNTAQVFCQHTPEDGCLNFISFEQYPVLVADLQRALQPWQTYFPQLIIPFVEQYISLTNGLNILELISQRIYLYLYIGDVTEGLANIVPPRKVDAWYLDGFSPAKNPQMWQKELFEQMIKHSKSQATFATFTSAGWVRRNLETAGFIVEKAPGFGKKRQMSFGYLK